MGKKSKSAGSSVVVYGVKYPLRSDPASGVWSIRKRTRDITIYENLGVVDESIAKIKAREFLGKRDMRTKRLVEGGATLQEVADFYEQLPKRVDPSVAKANLKRWAVVVREAWGKELSEVAVAHLNQGRLWEDYAAKRHGGKLDLSTRRHENRGINSAIRMAVSIFNRRLHVAYQRAGFTLDFEAIQHVEWLPEIPKKIPPLARQSEAYLLNALPALKAKDPLQWRALMMARFGGLRSKEIRHSQRNWLEESEEGIWGLRICDRPEIGFKTKTGADYWAPILSKELEDDLLASPEGSLLPITYTPDHFFKVICNNWIRQFIPRPSKGMHRLRALYLDHLRSAMGRAIRADEQAVEAAKEAAGHTKSRTTKRSYLQKPVIRTH